MSSLNTNVCQMCTIACNARDCIQLYIIEYNCIQLRTIENLPRVFFVCGNNFVFNCVHLYISVKLQENFSNSETFPQLLQS